MKIQSILWTWERCGGVVQGAGFEIWRSLVQILYPTAVWICPNSSTALSANGQVVSSPLVRILDIL